MSGIEGRSDKEGQRKGVCFRAGSCHVAIRKAAAGPKAVRCRRNESRQAPAANGHVSAGGIGVTGLRFAGMMEGGLSILWEQIIFILVFH